MSARCILGMVVALSLGWSASAGAALVAHESFEGYTADTAVDGGNLGTGWTTPWSGQPPATVVEQALSYSGGDITIDGGNQALQITGADTDDNMVNRSFAPQSDTFYFSFLFQSPTAGADTDRDFIQIWVHDGPFATSMAAAIHDQVSGDDFRFWARIAAGSGGSEAPPPSTVVGDTYFVVGKVSKTDGSDTFNRVDVFVNPTTLSEPATSTTSHTGDTNREQMSVLGIRTALLEQEDLYFLDEFHIGSTWAAVIPEPSSLLIVGLLGGGLLLRRRV